MVKFLSSLIKHSMQPARRANTSTQQAEPLSPLNPMQESLPIRPGEHPRQSLQQDASSTTAPLTQSQREESTTEFETGRSGSRPYESTSRRIDETQTASDESPLPDILKPRHLLIDRPATHSISTTTEDVQSKTPDAQNEMNDAPAVAGKPSFPVGQTEIETRMVFAGDRVAGGADYLITDSSQTPGRTGEAEAIKPLPSVESGTSKATEQNPPANPAQDEKGPGKPAQSPAARKDAPENTLSANKPQSRQTKDPVGQLRSSVQQERSALRGHLPGPANQQSQSRELPQVRIGQINVLVEDQASAKPRRSNNRPRPAASNPFGMRGL